MNIDEFFGNEEILFTSDYDKTYDEEYDKYGWNVLYGKNFEDKDVSTYGELLNRIDFKNIGIDLDVQVGSKDNMVDYTDEMADTEFNTGDILRFINKSSGKVFAQYILQKVGDSNGDGNIDISDVTKKRKVAVGKEEQSDFVYCDDVNADDSVDVADVISTRLRITNEHWLN